MPGSFEEWKDLQREVREEAGEVGRGHVNQLAFTLKSWGAINEF